MKVDFDTTKRIKFKIKARAAIAKLVLSKAYRKPLESPSCEHDDPEGLVTRTFRYKGRSDTIVRCHAKVMVGLLKAMLRAPTIQITASSVSVYSGSYRSWDQQNWLYQEYLAGRGYKAAHPCAGYHRQGRALDVLGATPSEEKAMTAVRVSGKKFYAGEVFGDDPHWSFGALG